MPAGGESDYFVISAGTEQVGGFMKTPPRVGTMAPMWLPMVGTADVDVSVRRAKELGAKVFMDKTQAGGIGSFAYLQSPTGEMFYVFKGNTP